jgi:hypothetical protein
MRLLRRTLIKVRVVARAEDEDALGGVTEDFSAAHVEIEASLSYVANTLGATGNNISRDMYGMRLSQIIRLRMEPGAPMKAGDGAMLPGEEKVTWRCLQVDEYPHVKVARLERIAGDGV